jgi:hypothetical protein
MREETYTSNRLTTVLAVQPLHVCHPSLALIISMVHSAIKSVATYRILDRPSVEDQHKPLLYFRIKQSLLYQLLSQMAYQHPEAHISSHLFKPLHNL